ncbi:hypothetical protein [Pseudomonas matsuisoli]|uniref:RiboL-PSP-HEPN domain-containing protein n=1 Tax=Pseudomonas matsuisoli TaxID=1515666 RepID=A0A917PNC2_9PSED|nr:hypothetical protein [Pseudomonas matsuisoli]GGJ85196.1 hypothetical protein GCM10009304_09020 [Pseudomonas matsuisoli]
MEKFLKTSNEAMLASAYVFDHARSAEKMTDPNCCGEENSAWQEGPFLSSPANERQIARSHPYCLRTSKEMAMTAYIVLGESPEKSENGGVHMPLPPKDRNQSRVEPVIAKLAIIEQFEIFKEFLESFDGPYNKKKRKEWEEKVGENVLSRVRSLTDRRNELTHDSPKILPTMKEAVECFYELRSLAEILWIEANNRLQRTAVSDVRRTQL